MNKPSFEKKNLKNLISKPLAAILAAVMVIASLCACGNNTEQTTAEQTAETNVTAETTAENGSDAADDGQVKPLEGAAYQNAKFDSVVLDYDEQEFEDAGYTFGDSVDVEFSNGYSLTDIPYLNGYYVRTGEPVLVAYPGNSAVEVTLNNVGLWTQAGLEYGDTAKVSLNTQGKYLVTYETFSQKYSHDRDQFETDEQFANFRALSGGNLKENFLYRGVTPFNNLYERAETAGKLIEEAGINCIVDLADSNAEIEELLKENTFDSAYAKKIFEDGHVEALALGSQYMTDTYKEGVAAGVRKMLECGGPCYIHCMEGKDRTGFVCMLLEAFAGASYDEMCADYMKTYENYYGITREKTPEKYEAVVSLYFDAFMEYLSGSVDREVITQADYSDAAGQYLMEGGLTDEEIEKLQEMILVSEE